MHAYLCAVLINANTRAYGRRHNPPFAPRRRLPVPTPPNIPHSRTPFAQTYHIPRRNYARNTPIVFAQPTLPPSLPPACNRNVVWGGNRAYVAASACLPTLRGKVNVGLAWADQEFAPPRRVDHIHTSLSYYLPSHCVPTPHVSTDQRCNSGPPRTLFRCHRAMPTTPSRSVAVDILSSAKAVQGRRMGGQSAASQLPAQEQGAV